MAYYECGGGIKELNYHTIPESYNTKTIYLYYTLEKGEYYIGLALKYNYTPPIPLDMITVPTGITKTSLVNMSFGKGGGLPGNVSFGKLVVNTKGKIKIEIPYYGTSAYPTYYSCMIVGTNTITFDQS